MVKNNGVSPVGPGHSPKGGAASSTASPAKPSVPNAMHPALSGLTMDGSSNPGLNCSNPAHDTLEAEVADLRDAFRAHQAQPMITNDMLEAGHNALKGISLGRYYRQQLTAVYLAMHKASAIEARGAATTVHESATEGDAQTGGGNG